MRSPLDITGREVNDPSLDAFTEGKDSMVTIYVEGKDANYLRRLNTSFVSFY